MHELRIEQLEDVVLECQKTINHHQARQLRAMAHIARKQGSEFDSEQVALLLKWTSSWAGDRMALAKSLTGRLPASLVALERGEIDLYKVESLDQLTQHLTLEHTGEVERRVLAKAPEQTGAQMRQYTRRMVARVDTEGARRRAQARKADRHAGLIIEDDDMAKIYAYLPTDRAVAIRNRVDRLARNAKNPEDQRTMDQRRADVVCDLLLSTPSGASAVQVQIHVTVPITMLMGLDDQPGELAGYGPITADLARELAADGTWRRLLTDPETGVLLDFGRDTYQPPAALRDFVKARDKTCRVPGCMTPAQRCDIDHTVPFPEGSTSPGNCGLKCRRHHRAKQHPDWTFTQPEPGTFTLVTPTGRTYTRTPEPVYPV